MTTGLDHAAAFLRALHPTPDAQHLIQIIGLKKGAEPVHFWPYSHGSDALFQALSLNAARYDLFAGVNPRATMAGGERSNIACVTALPIDIDTTKTRITLDSVLAGMAQVGLPPGLAVRSGHGGHLYLLLDRPYPLDEAEKIGRRVCLAFFSDAVWNASRIMRLPGTVNWKKTPSLCVLLGANPERRYSLETISRRLDEAGAPECLDDTARPSDALPPAPETIAELLTRVPPHVRGAIKTGHPPEWWRKSRSELDWVVVLSLVKAGATDDQIGAVYTHFRIRELKAGSAGGAYLAQTVKRARQEALRELNDQNPDLALLDDPAYYSDGRYIRLDQNVYAARVEEMIRADMTREREAEERRSEQPAIPKILFN